LKPQIFRILGWLIPALCIGLAGGLIYLQNQSFLRVSSQRNASRLEVQKAQEKKRLTDNLPSEHNYAAVEESRTEESSFLDYLKAQAATCGVAVVDWSSQSEEYGKSRSPSAEDQKRDALLKGLKRISSTVTVSGPFPGLRAMVMQLEASDRLYTLSSPKWARTPKGTNLTVVVSRYVIPETSSNGSGKTGAAPGIREI